MEEEMKAFSLEMEEKSRAVKAKEADKAIAAKAVAAVLQRAAAADAAERKQYLSLQEKVAAAADDAISFRDIFGSDSDE